ncbi:MAG: hypothetical protein JW940_27195 [Polyangiaceae bacterium]|nr:hypothetical protein [Polyangiaceae bacterium]
MRSEPSIGCSRRTPIVLTTRAHGARRSVTLCLQCLWDKGQIEARQAELIDLSLSYPGTWLSRIIDDVLEHGKEHGLLAFVRCGRAVEPTVATEEAPWAGCSEAPTIRDRSSSSAWRSAPNVTSPSPAHAGTGAQDSAEL